ncbi:MAG: MFS transporter [Acidimicrobiales bacterium]
MERELGGRLWQRAGALVSPLQLPDFRRLWAADMISLLGDWAGRLALTVLVLDRTGSPAWAAAVTAVSLAGWVGIGQVLATLADRVGRLPVMLSADLARAALFCAMLLDLPVGALLVLAFLAGVATPPFEAARSAALPDIVPEHRYGDALALSGISIQASLVVGNMLGGVLLVLVGARGALAINALSFLVSGVFILGLRHTAAAAPASTVRTVRGSLREGAANLFGDRMVRRALVIIAMTGALGTVDEALVVPYAAVVGISNGFLGLLAAAVPIGTLIGTAVIARSSDHHTLLRSAGLCTFVTATLAVPLYWLEVGGPGAFVAFIISGGMFAVSIPTNVVIGTRLLRDTRASAMGIAVGILMGGQAAGAAIGGVVASVVGPPRAIAGSLALAALFGAWSTVTTPVEAKHLAGRRRVIPITPPPIAGAGLLDPPSVVDLDALGDGARGSGAAHAVSSERPVARVS